MYNNLKEAFDADFLKSKQNHEDDMFCHRMLNLVNDEGLILEKHTKFFNSLIAQMRVKGYLSRKQLDLVWDIFHTDYINIVKYVTQSKVA